MTFEELPLEYEVLDGLAAMNFREPTPVQEQTIPLIVEGRDVISCAQTGTGKTAAYTLPLLSNLILDGEDPSHINAIIMAPTRELAQQIDQQMEGFSYYVPFSSVAVYGGNDGQVWEQQKRGLTQGADIVIATPGRLLSHMSVYDIDFSHVHYFILDEADRMLDMGFFDDIMTIVRQLPKDRQTILFSATMPPKIRELAKTIMNKPAEVKIAISRPPESIQQSAYICYAPQKLRIVKEILKAENDALLANGESALSKVVLFAGKKMRVKEITRTLQQAGIKAQAMHSDLQQAEREKVMHEFRSGRVDVLVATDIVSRGIDVDDIPMVINFDVPQDCEDYVHRIGRTARAGSGGKAITLVSEEDQPLFRQIENFLGYVIKKNDMPEGMQEGPVYGDGKHKPQRGRTDKKPQDKKPRDNKPKDGKGRKPSSDAKPQDPQREKQGGEKQEKQSQKPRNDRKPRNQRPKQEKQEKPEGTQQAAGEQQKQNAQQNRKNNQRRKPQQGGGNADGARQNNRRPNRGPKPEKKQSQQPAQQPEKKGLLARIKGFFTGK